MRRSATSALVCRVPPSSTLLATSEGTSKPRSPASAWYRAFTATDAASSVSTIHDGMPGAYTVTGPGFAGTGFAEKYTDVNDARPGASAATL